MARPAYKITAEDFASARTYIERARTRGEIGTAEAYGAWLAADTPERLQRWCDDYLPPEVWTRMLASLRQARKRSRDHRRPKRHVDLSQPAWLALGRMAEELGVETYSEAVLRLEEILDKVQDEGLLEPERPGG